MWRHRIRRSVAAIGASLSALGPAPGFGAGPAAAQPPAVTAMPGRPALQFGAFDLDALGYTTEEFFVEGAASSYEVKGPMRADGRWKATVVRSAPFTTRIVAVRPSDPARFNGTVIVEWLNVTAGSDTAAVWSMTHRELLRGGYAWVGVSAQQAGVEGGPSLSQLSKPLKELDPARYGRLRHPGDAYAFDIFSQAGRLARNMAAVKVLGPLAPERLIAAGESQSAIYLTTYVNVVAPLAEAFDGYFIHSRYGPAARLDGASTINAPAGSLPERVTLRTDLRAPVLTLLTESDVIGTRLPGHWTARQPDTTRLRTWEIAGAAHADTYFLQVAPIDTPATPLTKIAASYTPSDSFFGASLAKPMNAAPQHHYVAQAAIAGLDRWIRTGAAPASAAPLQLSSTSPPALTVDAHGLAVGGVRTPWVDTPAARHSGVGNSGAGVMGSMVGATEVFDQSALDRLYPGGKRDYLRRFEAALDRANTAGFLLASDREEILGLAELMYPGAR